MMKFIEWDNDLLNTGYKMIDDQHMVLVEVINELYVAFLSTEDDNLAATFEKALDDVIDYIDYHFAAEEKIINALNYSLTAEHLQQHRQFQRAVAELAGKLRDRDNPNIKFLSKKLLTLLKQWLLKHIIDTDKNFVRECAMLLKANLSK